MRHDGSGQGVRTSALWGSKGGSRTATLAAAALAALLLVGSASGAARDDKVSAFVPQALLQAAQAHPDQSFDVIVQGDKDSHAVANDVASEHGSLRRQFQTIAGAAATLSGKDLLKLAQHKHVTAITPDVRMRTSGYQDATMWRSSVNFGSYSWSTSTYSTLPSIAIVDSGIQDRKEFPKVLAHVNFSSLSPGATGDQEGHGTMVAGITGGTGKYAGLAQSFPLLDVRTADAQGQSLTSDVIAACDWMIANKAKYNIRVANFSMSGTVASSFTNDPLDKAVEKLWLNGIVVVTAAGNNGTGTGPVGIGAPANDPFVLTVGALDINSTYTAADDTVPSWSAYGYTSDGFGKPELSAPGRYLISEVPLGSTLATSFPDRVTDPFAGLMWMSGTSFAAPVVSGAAALVLFKHPDWTPDQVKGALMATARPTATSGLADGVGEVDLAGAANVASPPNPNAALEAFVAPDPTTGQPTFSTASWAAAATAGTFSQASWSNAGWTDAAWSSASWAAASWAGASWAAASWAGASWAAAVGVE